jgi:hypothetical protein
MKTTPSLEELLLAHYGELDPAAHARLHAQLREDSASRERMARVRLALADLKAQEQAPDAAAQQRWRQALARAARLDEAAPTARHWRWEGYVLAGLSAACVLAVILVSAWMPGPSRAPLPPHPPVAVERGVQAHLAITRNALASLSETPDPAARRALVERILRDNRLHVEAAEHAGDARLARVLRAFEPVLLALAQPEDAALEDGLRAQLDFEARAMQTQLQQDPSKSRVQAL